MIGYYKEYDTSETSIKNGKKLPNKAKKTYIIHLRNL